VKVQVVICHFEMFEELIIVFFLSSVNA